MKNIAPVLFLTLLCIYLYYKCWVTSHSNTKAIIDEIRSSHTNTQAMLNKPVKRGQGRPKGSKNKATMKRGR